MKVIPTILLFCVFYGPVLLLLTNIKTTKIKWKLYKYVKNLKQKLTKTHKIAIILSKIKIKTKITKKWRKKIDL